MNQPIKKYSGAVAHFMPPAYGFIYCDELKRKVFFHVSNFNSASLPVIGESVEFELTPSKGKPDAATNVGVL